MTEKLLTPKEVAEILRVPESTIRWFRHNRTGPKGILIGKRLVYRESAVQEYLKELEQEQHN